MSGDQRYSRADAGRQTDGSLEAGDGDTEPSMLLSKLKSNISKNVQTKVDQILQDLQTFSDNDKLFLYLQLPSGPGAGDKIGTGDSTSFNTADQLHTCNWIRSHLEEHSDTCLPKQDVYETYRRYCENLQHHPLSAANFGKIIRDIFPNIKARRLGGRGQSKYCYSGIRRKTVLNMPLLPNLDLKNDPAELTELVQTYKQEVTEAACELICDWAQKILKRSFDTVVEIARYLIQEHIVNPRCSQAELVTSATLAGGPAKTHKVIKKAPVVSKVEGDTSADPKQKEPGDPSSSLSVKVLSGDKSTAKPSSLDASPSSSSSALRPAACPHSERKWKWRPGFVPPVSRSQVEVFIKQLPRILPRSSLPDKTLSVRTSPPSLAPKDASGAGGASGPGGPAAASAASGGAMKVITMATLPQQQGGPVPVMILPQGCLSYDRDKVAPPPQPPGPSQPQHGPATPTSVVQKARGGATKRQVEAVGLGGGVAGGLSPAGGPPAKRKRGRPRKPRPEDPLPAPPAPLSHPPIITSLSGGVIQKASSSSSSRPLLELVIQEPPGLVLSQLPTVSDPGRRLLEHRGVVVQCQPGTPTEPDRHGHPLLFFQSPGNSSWELAAAGRTPMVEVIQKAPRPNDGGAPPPTPRPHPSSMSLPTLQEECAEVEVTLSPVELQVSPAPASTCSPVEKTEEAARSATSSQVEEL